MKAINFLNTAPDIRANFEKLFEFQIHELIKLEFPKNLIEAFEARKSLLLHYLSIPGVYKEGTIPFLFGVPTNLMSFDNQFNEVHRTGAILVEAPTNKFKDFFSTGSEAMDISQAWHKRVTYFPVNIEFQVCEAIGTNTCRDLKKIQESKKHHTLNHAETLMLLHLAPNIFKEYEKVLAPGLSWDDDRCPAFAGKNRPFNISWYDFSSEKPKPKELGETALDNCFAVCTDRI